MLMTLVTLATVITVPILIMLAACLLERVEATLVPAVRMRARTDRPSSAPSTRLSLVAGEGPPPPPAAEGPLRHAS